MSASPQTVDVGSMVCGPGPNDGLVARLPRPVAFVLSGGAASGATQVGMLLALRDAGVAPDLIIGTSVGAINGVMVAADPADGARRLRDVWTVLDKEGLLGSSSLRCLPRLVRTRQYLYEAEGLRALIRRHLGAERFGELAVPFVAVATAVSTGTTALLQRGGLEQALLASAAIPGVFPQVAIGGERYLDGGVTANVPLRQAFRLGAASAVVLNAAPAAEACRAPVSIAGTINYAVSLMMRNQAAAQVSGAEDRFVVRLPQTSPADVGVFDFSRAGELIDRARAVSSAWLRGAVPAIAS